MFGLASMDGVSQPCSVAMDCLPDLGMARPMDMDISVSEATPYQTSSTTTLPDLPSELIDHILSYLEPIDLVSASLVNHLLHAHANADHLWQNIVQSNVPGVKLTTPYPCASFRELYIAHDPRWFLTKYKVWFCDRDLTGKLVIVRYDQRRGVIEGYQLLANREVEESSNHSQSLSDREVVIHEFEPELRLHLDKPVLQLRADSLENAIRATARRSSTHSIKGLSGTAPTTITTLTTSPSTPVHFNSLAAETPMPLDDRYTDTMFNNFMLARSVPESSVQERSLLPFPYGNIWPPPAIPASERVSAAHFMREGGDLMSAEDRPTKRSEISEKAFRIRSWMEMRPAGLRGVSMGWLGPTFLGDSDWSFDSDATTMNGVFGQASRPWLPNYIPGAHPSMSAHIGDQVTTYSTLDPESYTPTADQPWRGIWVGDYSGHGCEFLLITQTHSGPFNEAAFDATRLDDETDSEFHQRKADARRYRGRLEAIKLTGDPNVPRGECTFVAEDLGEEGYVTTVEEQPFRGTRVVKSKGHVAENGFVNDRYIKSQLLLISENRLAQYWVGYGHISFFERVDIDKFLVPN
ncbi:Protein EXECUTER 2, chloroplastic [Cytospora mali]|uniref:Protein EXECUTER 2, chloroplastic n=1 Tax=Cytospora mali TaxID=578113 RepID=A0A194UW64_CYTMA|nr:Protein EXECUTER 2, chloroplastic [Valsa mali var. pyri (nom. inval.)]